MLRIEGEASLARLLRPGLGRVYPGRPGSGSIRRVDRVLPGQLPGGFSLRPVPVPGPGQPGPKSTRRAGPGFKTMLQGAYCIYVGIKWPNCLTLLQGKRSNETWHYYEAADVQGIERIIIYIYIYFFYIYISSKI
jgi:hypothetical protein